MAQDEPPRNLRMDCLYKGLVWAILALTVSSSRGLSQAEGFYLPQGEAEPCPPVPRLPCDCALQAAPGSSPTRVPPGLLLICGKSETDEAGECRTSWLGHHAASLGDGVCHDLGLVGRDLRHNYWGRPLAVLGLSVALAAPLANTPADQGIRDWYQQHVRSHQTDAWARVGKAFGDHWITVPALVGGLM